VAAEVVAVAAADGVEASGGVVAAASWFAAVAVATVAAMVEVVLPACSGPPMAEWSVTSPR
jgi:hypothetical protein